MVKRNGKLASVYCMLQSEFESIWNWRCELHTLLHIQICSLFFVNLFLLLFCPPGLESPQPGNTIDPFNHIYKPFAAQCRSFPLTCPLTLFRSPLPAPLSLPSPPLILISTISLLCAAHKHYHTVH